MPTWQPNHPPVVLAIYLLSRPVCNVWGVSELESVHVSCVLVSTERCMVSGTQLLVSHHSGEYTGQAGQYTGQGRAVQGSTLGRAGQ